MNYGVIPAVTADNAEEYRRCIDLYRMAGITANRIIVATSTKVVVERLKPGDMLVMLYQACSCSHVDEILNLMEQLLSKGITLCFCNQNVSIIKPEDLPILRTLMKRVCRWDEKVSS